MSLFGVNDTNDIARCDVSRILRHPLHDSAANISLDLIHELHCLHS